MEKQPPKLNNDIQIIKGYYSDTGKAELESIKAEYEKSKHKDYFKELFPGIELPDSFVRFKIKATTADGDIVTINHNYPDEKPSLITINENFQSVHGAVSPEKLKEFEKQGRSGDGTLGCHYYWYPDDDSNTTKAG